MDLFNSAPPMVGQLIPDYMELFDYLFSHNAEEIKRKRGVCISDIKKFVLYTFI